MTMNAKQIRAVLTDINSQVPTLWRKAVVKEVEITPTVRMVMEKALDMESIDPKKKEQIKALLDAGEFSKKQIIEDPKYAKLIDQFITRKINVAIKAGQLPNRKALKKILEDEKNNSPEN